MIKVGFDLGIFKILAKANSAKSAEEIAKEAGADPELISRHGWTKLSSRI